MKSAAVRRQAGLNEGELRARDLRIFVVADGAYVIAGAMYQAEDQGGHSDPGRFDGSFL